MSRAHPPTPTYAKNTQIITALNGISSKLDKLNDIFCILNEINDKMDDTFLIKKRKEKEQELKEQKLKEQKLKEEYPIQKQLWIEEHFKKKRDIGINEIIKYTFNPNLSELDNWLFSENKYDFPFDNCKTQILKYIESLFMPITIYDYHYWHKQNINGKARVFQVKGIILEDKIYMFIAGGGKYYDDIGLNTQDNEYQNDYFVIEGDLYMSRLTMDEQAKFNNSYYQFNVDYKKNYKYIKNTDVLEKIFIRLEPEFDLETLKKNIDRVGYGIDILNTILLSKIMKYLEESYKIGNRIDTQFYQKFTLCLTINEDIKYQFE